MKVFKAMDLAKCRLEYSPKMLGRTGKTVSVSRTAVYSFCYFPVAIILRIGSLSA